VLVPIVVLIVIAAAIAFQAFRQPVFETPVTSSSQSTATTDGTPITNLNISERTISGLVETPSPLAQPYVAALIGSQVIARTAVKDNEYTLILPASLETTGLTGLEQVKLPNGEGRLKAAGAAAGAGDGVSDDVVGANIQFVAFDDANGNSQPDTTETSVSLVPFRAGQDEAMRGFFRYGLLVLSKAARLKETQDHPTGAKGFYRYDLELAPGWRVIEGELASQGFDVRQSTGNNFDLIVPRVPSGNKPAGLEK
jgi:hypothetical protein